ncbi:PAS domain-containing protein, partial [Candidatus Venteria ishoeyi]|uniref:PAS domain-containing protein n=1 Tax=Candidatus Venteria ishoeyi TaxID=1899563 RepID=UPI000AA1B3B5
SQLKDDKGNVISNFATVKDITKRKNTELQLLQSSQLLEESQSIAQVGGWELDLSTNKLFWTAETYRIHDTSPEEFDPTVDAGVGYFLPESRRIISEALQAAIEHGQAYDLILKTFTTKGRLIDVRTTCEVTMIDGRPTRLTGIFQDITEQKRVENELIIAKETAERYLYISGSAFVSLDTNGNIILINQKCLEILEYDKTEELNGKNWFETCLPSEGIESVKQVFAKVMRGETDGVQHFENEVVTKSGKRRLIYWSNSYIKGEEGQVKYLLSSGIDFTERKQAEINLKESEEKYRLAMDATTDGLWDWNIQTGNVYFSPTYSKILGEKHIASEFESWDDRIHPNEKEHISESIQNHLNGETDF